MIKTPLNSSCVFKTLVLILSGFPLLPYAFRSITTIILILLSLVVFFKKNKNQNNFKGFIAKPLVFITLPFFAVLISLIYSSDLDEGVNKIVQMLSLLVIPLVFFLAQDIVDKHLVKKTLLVFSISVIVLVFYEFLLCIINYEYLNADLSQTELKLNNIKESTVALDSDIVNKIKTRRLRRFLLDKTDTHSTYLGMWIVFTSFILYKDYFKINKKRKQSLIVIITIAFLAFWLFVIASRISFVTVITLFLLLAVFNRKRKLSFKKLALTGISGIIILISSYKLIPGFQNRTNEVFQFGLNLPSKGLDIYNFNSTNVRYGIYFCSFKTIKDNFLFGVGVGDIQNKLNNCYSNNIGSKIYTWHNYNSHNQFLFFALSSGVLGIAFYLLSLFFQFKISLKNRNRIFLSYLMIIICFSFTENILVRSDGILFYSFFSSIFIFNKDKSNL